MMITLEDLKDYFVDSSAPVQDSKGALIEAFLTEKCKLTVEYGASVERSFTIPPQEEGRKYGTINGWEEEQELSFFVSRLASSYVGKYPSAERYVDPVKRLLSDLNKA